ncbi:Glutamate carboxypeptidase-like protein [Phytophthora cactorum]|nr:Glutamate carboxypeptidase-like protein [Phytophthora cactorum]
MPLSTPLASPGPVRSRYEDHETLEDALEAYGTFHGRAARVQQTMALSGFGDVVTGPSELMLLQSHYESVSGREEESSESATKTATLSHTHKDKDKSDGLSKLESKFLDSVDTTEIRKFHGAYASVPHPAGSHQDYKTALFTAEQFESFGLKAEIVEYYPLLSLPIHRKLSILAPSEAARELNLTEASIPGDSCTSNEDALPPYLGYSDSATSRLPWWKIALVRYGGNFRGLKVMLAEQHGWRMTDTLKDGIPEGPWRPEGSFQRGSQEECKTIPHIPTLPLSYGQARYILESLEGKKAPDPELGRGYGNSIGPIWDVIGTIEGTEEPDQMSLSATTAMRGCVGCGSSSGSADGWKPRRTLVIASWDGEELGLLGSTEFAEDHAELLKKQAVAYVNVDNVVGPFVSSGGTPSIAKFLQETAQLILATRSRVEVTENLYEQWLEPMMGLWLQTIHLIQFLGSGTDFTAFYQHLGIISANLATPSYRHVRERITALWTAFLTWKLWETRTMHAHNYGERRIQEEERIRKLETERHFWNEKLVSLERYLLSDAGLPHRYKGAAFPGLSDCIVFEDDNTAIQTHVDDVAAVINTAAAF